MAQERFSLWGPTTHTFSPFLEGNEFNRWWHGLAGGALAFAAAGLIFTVVLLFLYTAACGCGCFGGAKHNPSCRCSYSADNASKVLQNHRGGPKQFKVPVVSLGLLVCSLALYLALAGTTFIGIANTASGTTIILDGLDLIVVDMQQLQVSTEDSELALLQMSAECVDSARQIREQSNDALALQLASNFTISSGAATSAAARTRAATDSLHASIQSIRDAINRIRGPLKTATAWAGYMYTGFVFNWSRPSGCVALSITWMHRYLQVRSCFQLAGAHLLMVTHRVGVCCVNGRR